MPDPDATAELLDDQIVSLAPSRRESSGRVLRWLALAVVVAIVLVVGISVASRSEPPVAVVGSAGQSATDLTALATSAPSPTVDVDACAEGSTEVLPVLADANPGILTPLRLTRPGALALAIEEDRASGEVIVAHSVGDEAGSVDARVVAKFTGYDIQLARAVTPVAWSAQGDAILINAGHLDQFETERNCSDLFLVRADGLGVTQLTQNRAGEWANASALSPDGRRLARVAGGDLRVIEVDGASPGVALTSCFDPGEPGRWSPDGSWLLVVCGNEIDVVDLKGQRPHLYDGSFLAWSKDDTTPGGLSGGSLPLAAAWTPGGESIVAVVANAGPSQLGPLQIVELDRADGARIGQLKTDVSSEWVIGTSTISPDGRWALVQGDGNVVQATWFPTYAIDTSTGAVTRLPWTVIHDSTEPSSVQWLAEPGRFLYEEDQALFEVDLATMTRTEVGAVPASDYAWFEPPLFAPVAP